MTSPSPNAPDAQPEEPRDVFGPWRETLHEEWPPFS